MNEVQKNHDFMNLLGELERRFPVDEWVVDGVRVWPVARMHLYYGFFEHQFFSNHPARAGRITIADLPRVGRRIAASAWHFVKASVTDFRNTHHRNRAHDAVILNYQTYMTPLDGRWYSRVCDPFVEQFAARGLSSLMLTGGYEYATPRFTRSRFIQPHLVLHRLMGMGRRERGAGAPLAMLEAETFAKASGLFHRDFALTRPVEHHTRQIRSIARYFKRVLSAVRPKIVVVSCWYSTESMACLLACSELGIPTVDIQHGSQEFHVAYDRWNRVPETGYELVPTWFWCWSETEAAVIRAWAGTRRVHLPIAGGNLFLNRWVTGNDDTVRAYDRTMARLTDASGRKIQILYTLNGSTKDEIRMIVEIVRAVNAAELDAHFWIRLHPIALNQKALVESTLAEHRIVNAEVEQATALPLYAILRHMDVHITEFSSATIEAQSFGVPSVTGEQGELWFPGQVASGWAVMARTVPEWVAGIRQQLERRSALNADRLSRNSARPPDEPMERLLGALRDFKA